MSRNPTQEENQHRVDFSDQLRIALENAVPHNPEDPITNGDVAGRFHDMPDDYVISFYFIPQANQVYTTDPDAYRDLLEQAMLMNAETSGLSTEELRWLNDAAKHEVAHGQAAMQWGNSDTVSYFGLSILTDEHGPLFWPFHFVAGPLKKIHHALVAAAPDHLSETDKAVVRDLGYGDSIEDLQKRAITEAAVAEGWERQVSREEVIAALERMALMDFPSP